MDVVDYMLKPVQEEELIAVLNKVNQDYCHQQQEQRENYDFHVKCNRVFDPNYYEKERLRRKHILAEQRRAELEAQQAEIAEKLSRL